MNGGKIRAILLGALLALSAFTSAGAFTQPAPIGQVVSGVQTGGGHVGTAPISCVLDIDGLTCDQTVRFASPQPFTCVSGCSNPSPSPLPTFPWIVTPATSFPIITDGTPATGISQDTGGTGAIGWLSSIVKNLRLVVTAVQGTLTVQGTVTATGVATPIPYPTLAGVLAVAPTALPTISVACVNCPTPLANQPITTDGTAATGVSQDAGGAGAIGWLSSAVKNLRSIATSLSGTLTTSISGTVTTADANTNACKTGPWTNGFVDNNTSGRVTIVTHSGSTSIYLCAFKQTDSGTGGTYQLGYGTTTTNCGDNVFNSIETWVDITNPAPYLQNTGYPILTAPVGNDVCIISSSGTNSHASWIYVQK